MVAVSWGELVDKVTILQIKLERITDPNKLKNVQAELEALAAARGQALAAAPGVADLEVELKKVNEVIWENEDELREWERQKVYGPEFVLCARTAYRMNDRRCDLKRQINALLGSGLVEEKSYAPYE